MKKSDINSENIQANFESVAKVAASKPAKFYGAIALLSLVGIVALGIISHAPFLCVSALGGAFLGFLFFGRDSFQSTDKPSLVAFRYNLMIGITSIVFFVIAASITSNWFLLLQVGGCFFLGFYISRYILPFFTPTGSETPVLDEVDMEDFATDPSSIVRSATELSTKIFEKTQKVVAGDFISTSLPASEDVAQLPATDKGEE